MYRFSFKAGDITDRKGRQGLKAINKYSFGHPKKPRSFESCAASSRQDSMIASWLPPGSSCLYLGLSCLHGRMCCPFSPTVPGDWSHYIPFLNLGHPHVHLACPYVSLWSLLKYHLLREAFSDHLCPFALSHLAPQCSYYIFLCFVIYYLSRLGESELHGGRDMPPAQPYIWIPILHIEKVEGGPEQSRFSWVKDFLLNECLSGV